MRHRYSWLDPELIRQILSEMGLRRLFNHLLLQSGGDVEEAMRWMRMLQERGLIDSSVDRTPHAVAPAVRVAHDQRRRGGRLAGDEHGVGEGPADAETDVRGILGIVIAG